MINAQQLVERYRQIAHAVAGGVEYRVGHGCCDAGDAEFADSACMVPLMRKVIDTGVEPRSINCGCVIGSFDRSCGCRPAIGTGG